MATAITKITSSIINMFNSQPKTLDKFKKKMKKRYGITEEEFTLEAKATKMSLQKTDFISTLVQFYFNNEDTLTVADKNEIENFFIKVNKLLPPKKQYLNPTKNSHDDVLQNIEEIKIEENKEGGKSMSAAYPEDISGKDKSAGTENNTANEPDASRDFGKSDTPVTGGKKKSKKNKKRKSKKSKKTKRRRGTKRR